MYFSGTAALQLVIVDEGMCKLAPEGDGSTMIEGVMNMKRQC